MQTPPRACRGVCAHLFIACANCSTRLNTVSELRMPYRPAPPPSAAGATCVSHLLSETCRRPCAPCAWHVACMI